MEGTPNITSDTYIGGRPDQVLLTASNGLGPDHTLIRDFQQRRLRREEGETEVKRGGGDRGVCEGHVTTEIEIEKIQLQVKDA